MASHLARVDVNQNGDKRPQSVVDWVHSRLEAMIFGGEIVPGSRINELALSKHLEVSRGPIREAIRLLERAKLVEVRARRGAFVRWLPPEEVADLYDLRSVLAYRGGELAAQNVTQAQLERIQTLIREIDESTDEGSVREFFPLNFRLHQELLLAGGNTRLAETYQGIQRELRLYRQQQLAKAGASREIALRQQRSSNVEHECILEALRRRDAAAAAHALRDHDANGRTRSEEMDTTSRQ